MNHKHTVSVSAVNTGRGDATVSYMTLLRELTHYNYNYNTHTHTQLIPPRIKSMNGSESRLNEACFHPVIPPADARKGGGAGGTLVS